MHWLEVLRSAFRRGGIREVADVVIQGLYHRTIRRVMPFQAFAVFNGVTVGVERKVLDGLLPVRWLRKDTSDRPYYESALVDGMKRHVRRGDRVVIVGGGWGVTTVYAARAVGETGSVTTIEQSLLSVERVRWTLERDGCSDIVEVVHGRLEGGPPAPTPPDDVAVKPDELPECDVLELDCEGAELEILRRMIVRPRVLLVESHGAYGAPSKDVRETLLDLGYVVVSEQVAEAQSVDLCMERDIIVFEALRGSDADG